VGLLVAAWMFGAFAVLTLWAGLHPQPALALSYLSGLAIHFGLNRQWVFSSSDGYALHLSRQGRRYLLTVVTTYAISALSLLLFSGLLGANPLLVYYATAALLAAVTFLVFQRWVFHSHRRPGAPGAPEEHP
jgi:putative flippase GtrA